MSWGYEFCTQLRHIGSEPSDTLCGTHTLVVGVVNYLLTGLVGLDLVQYSCCWFVLHTYMRDVLILVSVFDSHEL